MGSLKTKSAFGKRTCENKSGLARFVSIKAAEYACRRGNLLDGAWGAPNSRTAQVTLKLRPAQHSTDLFRAYRRSAMNKSMSERGGKPLWLMLW
jgi:hypothetical protein